MEFLNELAHRNGLLFWFGWICLFGAIVMIMLILLTSTEVLGISAFVKPLKFFLSTTIFVWTIAWYVHYLNKHGVELAFTWTVIITLSFELIWITFKASQGELSHFNTSSSFNSMMFGLMGIAISAMTLFTLFIGLLFFQSDYGLAPAYLWGIRLGILCFVIFAFQGGIMGSQLSHTVGGPDGGPGLPFLNWSTKLGDYRIAHFTGMHALQVLPLAGYYLFITSRGVVIFSVIYFGLCTAVLTQALLRLPLIKM